MHRWFKPRTFLFIAPAVAAVAILGLVGAARTAASSASPVLFSRPTPATEQRLTLLQAWDSALQAARAWSTQAAVAQLQSVAGSDAAASGAAENDGRSPGWQAVLIAADRPNSELRLMIAGGVPVQALTEPRRPSSRAPAPLPAIDSPQALRLARAARPLLAPALEKGHGYRFLIEAGGDGKTIVKVLGSYHGAPAQVDLDGSSGRLVQASVYAWTGGGILHSSDAGLTWHARDLAGGQVTGVALMPGQPGRAFAVKPALDGVEVWESTNGGQTWRTQGMLPVAAGAWAYGLTAASLSSFQHPVLVAGTPSGLWISTDEGLSWQRNRNFPSGPPQWLSASRGADGGTVLVTISAGSNAGLYATSDLTGWEKVLDGVYRLSPTSDGRGTIALADSQSAQAYLIVGRAVHPVRLSIPALRAAGEFSSGRVAVAEDAAAVVVSKDGGSTWSTVLASPLTSLAVSPSLAQDGVIIAAGPEQGIFRSGDMGQTWQHVLASPKTVTPGSGWITQLCFLSSKDVIAVEGGTGSWQSF